MVHEEQLVCLHCHLNSGHFDLRRKVLNVFDAGTMPNTVSSNTATSAGTFIRFQIFWNQIERESEREREMERDT